MNTMNNDKNSSKIPVNEFAQEIPEKKPPYMFIGIGVVALLLVGIFVVKPLIGKNKGAQTPVETVEEGQAIAPADVSIGVAVTWHPTKDNTLVLTVNGLASKYTDIMYEISYDSMGIIQGVTSRPLSVVGMDTFTRDDIYLGTCSKNVCRPHPGVKSVTVVLEFTDTAGKKSQFVKEFTL
jgi:hypothetical protein